MSVLGKKWIVKSKGCDKPILDVLLENRGINTTEEKDSFLEESTAFHDPFLMKDMQKSVDRIMQAIEAKERIIIFGDYDVDGLTSSAILFHTLKSLGANHSIRLPNREKDGYGLSKKFIDEFIKLDIKLVITVDTGISCAKEISYARENDIDTIITDHHQVPETPPTDAHSINHPKQKDCKYPFEDLTGAGVALKLAHALFIHNLGEKEALNEIEPMVELAAMGTVADLGPAKGENRKIIKHGLRNLTTTSSPGLKILKELAGIKPDMEVCPVKVGYNLAPRLNAAGRIGDPYTALRILIGTNDSEIYGYGKELEELNRRRQEMTQETLMQAMHEFRRMDDQNALPFILVAKSTEWHVGIVGLTASKLADSFGRPAIIFQDLGDTLVASARSIEAFNIVEAIAAQKELLVTFGGHKEAAGLTIKKENYKKFKEKIEKYAAKKLKDKDVRPSLEIDCELKGSQIKDELVDELLRLKPFGITNKRPVFVIRNVKPNFISTVGRAGDHLKFEAEIGELNMGAIGFRMGELSHELRKHKSLDIACHIDFNEWNGKKNIQAEVVDMKMVGGPSSRVDNQR